MTSNEPPTYQENKTAIRQERKKFWKELLHKHHLNPHSICREIIPQELNLKYTTIRDQFNRGDVDPEIAIYIARYLNMTLSEFYDFDERKEFRPAPLPIPEAQKPGNILIRKPPGIHVTVENGPHISMRIY